MEKAYWTICLLNHLQGTFFLLLTLHYNQVDVIDEINLIVK